MKSYRRYRELVWSSTPTLTLGTFRGLTPYVGGGIGIASLDVRFKDVNTVNHAVYLADKDNSTTNFAWALYAGGATT